MRARECRRGNHFCEAVVGLFDQPVSIVATVQVGRHPVTDTLKARPDVEKLRLTRANRDRLPGELAERLGVTAGSRPGRGRVAPDSVT